MNRYIVSHCKHELILKEVKILANETQALITEDSLEDSKFIESELGFEIQIIKNHNGLITYNMMSDNVDDTITYNIDKGLDEKFYGFLYDILSGFFTMDKIFTYVKDVIYEKQTGNTACIEFTFRDYKYTVNTNTYNNDSVKVTYKTEPDSEYYFLQCCLTDRVYVRRYTLEDIAYAIASDFVKRTIYKEED